MPAEPRFCRPSGPRDHPLLALVGEAPGAEEARTGKPFVGNAGHLLDQLLRATGIIREECYITNVALERPPGNDFRAKYYSDAKGSKPTMELLDCRERLHRELHEVQPTVIIALGEEALRATCNKYGITEQRGKMIECKNYGHDIRIMPTYHPASLFHQYGNRPIVELDLLKAIRQARKPYFPPIRFQSVPTFNEIMEWLDANHSPVSFDIETLGTPPITRRIGFAWSESEAISIPLIMAGQSCWSLEQETIIIQRLNSYLGDPDVETYVQNVPFDASVVANELGIHVDGIVLDTMYAYHLLYPELPKKLDFLTSVFTDFPLYWNSKNHGDEPNAIYNCYDCCVTWISAHEIIKELKERHLYGFYISRTQPTMLALTRMQNRGILMDIDKREEIRALTESKLKASQIVLDTLAGREINANSPKQVQELIYNDFSLPKQKSPTTKKITTDDDALRALSRKFPGRAAALKAILDCRQTRKLISTYIDAELDNGYVRTSYGLTKTGRITSSKTIEGYGGNLQNIPRGAFRRLYRPDPGKVLIKADLSQAEYMVFCWEAEVHEYIEAYSNDPTFDVHLLNASRIYKIDMGLVTKEQRYNSKQGVYAGNYGIGANKLSKMHDMDFQQAKTIIDGYKESRPELEVWWTKIEELIKATRTLRNVFGRERIFFGRVDNALFRAAYDWVCQSTVADIINQALVELDKVEFIDVLLQVHDELVFQCDDNPETIARAVKIIKDKMEISIDYPNIETPMMIPVEIAVGPNWFDVTEIKEVA